MSAMSSLMFWRTADEQPSVSCEDAVADLASRLAAQPEVEAQLRAGGETGLSPPGRGLGAHTLRRWLVAEKWDVDAAFGRLVTHAQWRADYVSGRERRGRRGGNWGVGTRCVAGGGQRRRPLPSPIFLTPTPPRTLPFFSQVPRGFIGAVRW